VAFDVQHLNVKIFAREGEIDLAAAVPIFHRWIQDGAQEELLVDVADYRHVPEGPGVLLIAHQANYSLDLAEGRLGLLYNRKSVIDGDTQAKLRQAFGAALAACRTLEAETPFHGRLEFDAGDCEILINDRDLAPNTPETWDALRPELERFFGTLYGSQPFRLERRGEPRERFRVGVRTDAPLAAAAAAERLQGNGAL
jgi:hypothetical protein